MVYQIRREADGVLVAFSGDVDHEEIDAARGAAWDIIDRDALRFAIYDFSAAATIDLDFDSPQYFAQLLDRAAAARPDVRIALVFVQEDFRLAVRDYLYALRTDTRQPQLFDTLAEARAWVDGGVPPAG